MVCAQLFECRTIIMDGTQHLGLSSIQVIVNIDACAERSFTSPREDNKTRRMLKRGPHSRCQLIEHLNCQDIERGPIQDQPQQIATMTDMNMRCFCAHVPSQ